MHNQIHTGIAAFESWNNQVDTIESPAQWQFNPPACAEGYAPNAWGGCDALPTPSPTKEPSTGVRTDTVVDLATYELPHD